jgi:hypothetical protein
MAALLVLLLIHAAMRSVLLPTHAHAFLPAHAHSHAEVPVMVELAPWAALLVLLLIQAALRSVLLPTFAHAFLPAHAHAHAEVPVMAVMIPLAFEVAQQVLQGVFEPMDFAARHALIDSRADKIDQLVDRRFQAVREFPLGLHVLPRPKERGCDQCGKADCAAEAIPTHVVLLCANAI